MPPPAVVFARSYDPPLGFARNSALAPPQSEVAGAEPRGGNFSWMRWFPIRLGSCATFEQANPCGIESDMWTLVRALVRVDSTVLELGARYGTTSCVLAEMTQNSGRLVSVEPDPNAHDALRRNLRAHRCNAGVFRGTVGRTTQTLVEGRRGGRNASYERQTQPAALDAKHALDRLTPRELATLSGLGEFDTLVIDCEGCIEDLLAGDAGPAILSLFPRLEVLLVEADAPRRVSYSQWHVHLEDAGFRRVWRLEDSLYGPSAPVHMAYVRGSRRAQTCEEYANRQPGWRCQTVRHLVRSDFLLSRYKCASRLTCLSPEVVNGSRESVEVHRLRSPGKRHARARAHNGRALGLAKARPSETAGYRSTHGSTTHI
jgi:FkbM family methyltransferase